MVTFGACSSLHPPFRGSVLRISLIRPHRGPEVHRIAPLDDWEQIPGIEDFVRRAQDLELEQPAARHAGVPLRRVVETECGRWGMGEGRVLEGFLEAFFFVFDQGHGHGKELFLVFFGEW